MTAFTSIVERYQDMAYSVAYSILGNRPDTEDAVQEAFLRCYRRLGQYRGEAAFSTWLFRVVASSAVDLRRRERRRPEAVSLPPEIVDQVTPLLGEGPTAAALLAALGELPDDYRTPTVLRDVYGMPYREIAQMTGRPLGTVRVMVHRGRASLRLNLRARGLGPGSTDEMGGA